MHGKDEKCEQWLSQSFSQGLCLIQLVNVYCLFDRHHWMFSATAYNHAYLDSGLFCIHASAPPTNVHEMVEVIVKELVNMAGALGEPELQVNDRNIMIIKIVILNVSRCYMCTFPCAFAIL